jgi:hypothetical protein
MNYSSRKILYFRFASVLWESVLNFSVNPARISLRIPEVTNSDINKGGGYSYRGTQIFKKSRSYPKILGARLVAEELKIIGCRRATFSVPGDLVRGLCARRDCPHRKECVPHVKKSAFLHRSSLFIFIF